MEKWRIPKLIGIFLLFFCYLFIFKISFAVSNSYVTVVNPVRGNDFWDISNQPPVFAVNEEMKILQKFSIPATWLVRFDALFDKDIVNLLKNNKSDLGLLLEVTPTWTKEANVIYRESPVWHDAGSVFLTGYSNTDREKLIDRSFETFKNTLGFYPKSVGAWWIDSPSLKYMQKKYGVTAALIVADQYTTDNYQIWGQYWGYPYYPTEGNTIIPAQNPDHKIPVVVMQWAPRDPINGFGGGVQESTYSVQANDYLDYHTLKTDYFSKLVDVYTKQQLNSINQIVVGLENSYSWEKYGSEYQNQIQVLKNKENNGQISLVSMKDFANIYISHFPELSPEQIINTVDPLGSDSRSVWFMNQYYRAGLFYNNEGLSFRYIRQYVEGQYEPCYSTACDQLNFATFPIRVLDDVTYNQKLVIDRGRITDFQVNKEGGNYTVKYKNEGGKDKEIIFKSRDIVIDGKSNSIDGLIFQATQSQIKPEQNPYRFASKMKNFQESLSGFSFKIIKFLLFLLFALFIPGYLLVRFLKQESLILNTFLSVCIGMVVLALTSYIFGYLKLSWLVFIYILISAVIFFGKRIYQELQVKSNIKVNIAFLTTFLLIITGTIYQSLPLLRSGWAYGFGVGFWGPLGHDGIWHQALINQLITQVPPQNPGFSSKLLSNYHYFYDLLLAASYNLSYIPVADLLYRFYPVLLSLFLGIGTYLLADKLFKNKLITVFTLYFVYFAGSFGWIVEFIKEKHLGGESAFWINQPVSANLNPPFIISLVLIIAIILVIQICQNCKNISSILLLILLSGTLIEFKVYAGVLVLIGLGVLGLRQVIFERSWGYFLAFLGSTLLSLGVFLPQNLTAGELLVFSPFWFIHSMIDFPDRVGWLKLSQARQAYFERQEWVKYFMVEALGFFLFLIGNLGTRFVALVPLTIYFKRNFWKVSEYTFIFTIIFTSILVPTLFIQKGNGWNSIQFAYYFLYFITIFTGVTLWLIYQKLPKVLGIILVLFILIITPINSWATFESSTHKFPPTVLTPGELEGLSFLAGLPQGTVLTYPFDKSLRAKVAEPFPVPTYETTSYVSAYSKKTTYIEDEIQQEIFQNNYQTRVVGASSFFQGRDKGWSKTFLKSNNIRYIYLPKIFEVSLSQEELGLKRIFENEEAIIYDVI